MLLLLKLSIIFINYSFQYYIINNSNIALIFKMFYFSIVELFLALILNSTDLIAK